jgi:hypothetical protein
VGPQQNVAESRIAVESIGIEPVAMLLDVMNEFIKFVASAQDLGCLLVFSTRRFMEVAAFLVEYCSFVELPLEERKRWEEKKLKDSMSWLRSRNLGDC